MFACFCFMPTIRMARRNVKHCKIFDDRKHPYLTIQNWHISHYNEAAFCFCTIKSLGWPTNSIRNACTKSGPLQGFKTSQLLPWYWQFLYRLSFWKLPRVYQFSNFVITIHAWNSNIKMWVINHSQPRHRGGFFILLKGSSKIYNSFGTDRIQVPYRQITTKTWIQIILTIFLHSVQLLWSPYFLSIPEKSNFFELYIFVCIYI